MAATPGYEILGFSLIGPPPLGEIHLPWSQGVHVVYGRNGAGKTKLLEAIASLSPRFDSLEGGTAFVHLEYDPDMPFEPESDSHLPYEALAWDICESALRGITVGMAVEYLIVDEELAGFLHFGWRDTTLGEVVTTVVERVLVVQGWPTDQRFIEEVLSSSFISISSGGSIWLASRLGANTPHINKLVANSKDLEATPPPEWQALDILSGLRTELFYARSKHWPPTMPVPVVPIGRIGHFRGPLDVIGGVASDPEAETNEFVADMIFGEGSKRIVAADTIFEIPREIMEILEEVSDDTSNILKDVLQDAPRLKVELLAPQQWYEQSKVVAWTARDPSSGNWIPLSQLSEAQHKWALFAIGFVNSRLRAGGKSQVDTVLLVDEPERALHPTAIDYLMQDLDATAKNLSGPVILASHSPQILSWPGARLLHIARDGSGHATLKPLDLSTNEELERTAESLGLRKLDLLQTYRVFLVVEGLHDSTVLTTLFPEDWEANRIRILHMRGSKHILDLAGSEILRDFSDAQLVVLLDNVAPEIIRGLTTATSLAMDGKRKEAETTLRDLEKKAGHGERKAIELVRRTIAITRQYLDRPQNIHIRGLEKKDIIEYLDPSFFDLDKDWSTLRKLHRAEAGDLDFKDWLRESFGARINAETVKAAAQQLSDNPPVEFTDLLNFCIGLRTGEPPQELRTRD